jgi:cleavage and polyadenylation specificity factor subunit 3
MASKRVAEFAAVNDDDLLKITPLGAGREVGRSCILLQFKGKTIMFDCGVHPGFSGRRAMPYFDSDQCEPDKVDLILISHFHLDHCAMLPYFTQRTDPRFKGRVFMTHPTKNVYKMLLDDYCKLSKLSKEEMPYTAEDLEASMHMIEVVKYREVVEHNGIKFWAYNAGNNNNNKKKIFFFFFFIILFHNKITQKNHH